MTTPIENLQYHILVMSQEIDENDQLIDNVKNRIFELELRNKVLSNSIIEYQDAILALTK